MNQPTILLTLKMIYLPAGIFIDKKYTRFLVPYFITFHLLVTVGGIGVIATCFDHQSSNLENSHTIYAASTILAALWIGYLNTAYYEALYHEIEKFGTQFEEFFEMTDRMIKDQRSTIIGVYCTQLLKLLVPVYALAFANADIQGYLVLLYPSMYPWRRDTLTKYSITMVIQFLSLSFGYCLLTFFVGTFCCATLYIYHRFLFLKRRIITMEERVVLKIRSKANNFEIPLEPTFLMSERSQYGQFYRTIDDLMYIEFIDIVKEHQDLMKLTRRTKKNFSLPMDIVLGYAYFAAIILSTIVLEGGPEHNLHKMKALGLSSLAIISLTICCICGEVIVQLNESLKNTVSGTEWYNHSYKLRKLIVIFMMQNQRGSDIRAFRIFVMNNDYLGRALRFCYSCIQVLSSRKF